MRSKKLTIYRNAFKKLIQTHIKKVYKQDKYSKDTFIEQSKEKKKNTLKMKYIKCSDTDSKNDNSDNEIRNESKSFDDRFFVIIDEENEYKSDEYENDDEKDADDEN